MQLIKKDGTINEITKESLKGEKLILFFFPRTNTPGWIIEGKDFSGLKSEFNDLGYRLIGISRDKAKAHQNFMNKQDLTVDLISDSESELCDHFDVVKEKLMFGKISMGIERSTFILDEEFNIVQEFRKVKVNDHASTVLEAVKAIEK